ncbi:MAG: RNA 2',3'-cyclic phosphodiesterase [Thermoprotei archaeon]
MFVACDLDDPNVVEQLVDFQREVLSPFRELRLVHPDAMHFTLAFLADQDSSSVGVLKQRLKEVHAAPFKLSLAGVTAFPTPERPRVIVASVERGSNELSALAQSVRAALAAIGVWYDSKPFVPHMTLARASFATTRLSETLRLSSGRFFGEVVISTMRLKSSELTPAGPLYRTLAELPLEE